MNTFEHVIMGTSAYLGGIFMAIGTFFGQLATNPESSWYSIAIQAGMMGVVLLLLLKFFPDLQRSQRETTDRFLMALTEQRVAHDAAVDAHRLAYEATIERIVHEHELRTEAHERQMENWRKMIALRGYCPRRDGAENG